MNNWGYREIHRFDTIGLKQLNDTLLALWARSIGARNAGSNGGSELEARVALLEAQMQEAMQPK